MIHFSTVKANVTSREHLIAALRDLGFEPQVAEESKLVQVRGWMSRRAQAEVVVQSSVQGYDIGFTRNTTGTYDAVADWSIVGQRQPQESLMQQIVQRAAYHATMEALTAQGFSLVQQETDDGAIVLTLMR
jgi:hypothetical protein